MRALFILVWYGGFQLRNVLQQTSVSFYSFYYLLLKYLSLQMFEFFTFLGVCESFVFKQTFIQELCQNKIKIWVYGLC